MRLGGVILSSLGILVTVLVANGRWSSVWAAMLGPNAGTSPASGGTSSTGGSWGTAQDVPAYTTPTGGGW